MEKAVDNLEALFQKAETNLNYLSRKLQFQVESAHDDDGNKQSNPVKLMNRIEEIKSEYSALVQDISAIQTAQKEAMGFFSSTLVSITQALSKLEAQTQQEIPELTEETSAVFEELSKLLGVNILPQGGGDQGNDQEITDRAKISREEVVSAGHGSDSAQQPTQGEASAQVRRMQSCELVEVSLEEFMSVSELVRGKVKLEDVNRTYKMLWQHFKAERHRDALTPQEMNSMGLRVSGATGEAKLKVLRALKLCQISKNGDVKLV